MSRFLSQEIRRSSQGIIKGLIDGSFMYPLKSWQNRIKVANEETPETKSRTFEWVILWIFSFPV